MELCHLSQYLFAVDDVIDVEDDVATFHLNSTQVVVELLVGFAQLFVFLKIL